eukprot:scaffold2141_cov282-Pinguiococcus_pyrenoidosus.AAC.27
MAGSREPQNWEVAVPRSIHFDPIMGSHSLPTRQIEAAGKPRPEVGGVRSAPRFRKRKLRGWAALRIVDWAK